MAILIHVASRCCAIAGRLYESRTLPSSWLDVMQAEVSVDALTSRSLTSYVKTTSPFSLQPHMSPRIRQGGGWLSLVPGTASCLGLPCPSVHPALRPCKADLPVEDTFPASVVKM